MFDICSRSREVVISRDTEIVRIFFIVEPYLAFPFTLKTLIPIFVETL